MKRLLAILLSTFLFISFSYSQERELSDYEKYRMAQEKELYQTDQEEEVFYIVEDMPKFKGKDADEFRNYIAKNVVYPKEAREEGISGKVIVSFIVNKDGYVTNAKIEESADYYLDKEALRVVESSPRWTPGKQEVLL